MPQAEAKARTSVAIAARRDAETRAVVRARREQELLRAAGELFAAQGYSATRLEDVAQRAGVAKGLVAFYFKSKERLFQAVVRKAIPPILAELELVLANGAGKKSAELLREAMTLIMSRVADESPRAILRLLAAEGRNFPELTAFYYDEVVAHSGEALDKIIERGVQSGEFSFQAREQLPRLLLGPPIMAVFWQILFGDRQALDMPRLLHAHMDLILHGISGERR